MKSLRVLTPVLVVVAILTAPFWGTHLLWRGQDWQEARVQLVDYTVPFSTGREHRGAAWLLNHEKYRPPVGTRWAALGTHVGYDPRDRENPVALHRVDLTNTDWLILTDAYGVYVDDLKHIGEQRTHMDYSGRLFGGLSRADAEALDAHIDRGGHVLLEFNALEEPTEPEARAILEDRLGVRWTEWTGRVFLDLYDTTDVPHWLPRNFRERYGHDSMPHGPTLAFAHKDGRLFLVPAGTPSSVAPRLAVTAEGTRALPGATGGAPYYYWFPIITADEGTEVLGELELPDLPGMDRVREATGIPARIPMLTRRTDGGSHRLYLAADLSDTDFDPGAYAFYGLGRLRTATEDNPFRVDGANAFWQFYVPAVTQVLREPFAAPRLQLAAGR